MISAPNHPLPLSGNKTTTMRLFLIFLFFLNVLTFQASAQNYRTHTVEDEDTVYSLAEKYNTTEEAIYELNPGSKESIRLGQVLVIPPKQFGEEEGKEPLRFEDYVVKPKETVFGISQQNGIDMADLKKYNPYLYKEELGMGDTIQIPVYTRGRPQPINYNESIQNSSFGNLKHVVLPKETRYGIAQKYNIEIKRLKELNPNMGVIQPGQVLVVRNTETNINEAVFTYYVVKSYDKGSPETIFSLTRKFGISRDSLFALNPSLEKDGLEAGMKLKVPKLGGEASYSIFSSKVINLEEKIQNYETKELVVMLPFKIKNFKVDSVSRSSQLAESRISQISLDFYSGVLMALNAAKAQGISVNLRTYDTEQSKNHVEEIIRNNDFENVQAVIGPLLGDVIETTARELSRKNIPVFSPLTKMEMTAYDNLVQTRPTDAQMENVMISYIDSIHTDQNIVIITDSLNVDIKNKLKAKFATANVFMTRIGAVTEEENDYLKKEEIAGYLDDTKENWVILETENILLLNIATSYLDLLQSKYKIRLFTTNRNDAYESDEVSNANLSSLKFTFPAFTREFNGERATGFINKYQKKHGIKPSKFAVRGYDLTYDILLRLAASKDFYDSFDVQWTTEYIENKFHYKKKENGGYVNNAVYILQYGNDLSLKPIGL